MSIEKHEEILEKSEFYKKIYDGLNDLENGRTVPYWKVIDEILNN